MIRRAVASLGAATASALQQAQCHEVRSSGLAHGNGEYEHN